MNIYEDKRKEKDKTYFYIYLFFSMSSIKKIEINKIFP